MWNECNGNDILKAGASEEDDLLGLLDSKKEVVGLIVSDNFVV